MLCDVQINARPDAIRVGRQIELDDALENSYDRMTRDGWHFAADVLPIGDVALTIERAFNDPLDVKITANERESIRRAYETLLMRCFPCRGRDLPPRMEKHAP